MTKTTKTASFEDRIGQLESLVEQLEKGALSLDDSLTAFEKGVSLTKSCLTTLKQAELKVKQLDSISVDAELTEISIKD